MAQHTLSFPSFLEDAEASDTDDGKEAASAAQPCAARRADAGSDSSTGSGTRRHRHCQDVPSCILHRRRPPDDECGDARGSLDRAHDSHGFYEKGTTQRPAASNTQPPPNQAPGRAGCDLRPSQSGQWCWQRGAITLVGEGRVCLIRSRVWHHLFCATGYCRGGRRVQQEIPILRRVGQQA